jgi:uncharacterized protein
MEARRTAEAGGVLAALHREASRVRVLCDAMGVVRLELFGSAAVGADTEESDADFLVAYAPGADLGPWLARHFELRLALEEIVGRTVDLVMLDSPGARNPRFARMAEGTRTVVYASEVPQATR